MGVAGGFKAVALRFPDRVGVIDELGELTFAEIERRSNALADSLAQLGVGEGDGVAILVRNHRGFLDASLAAAKLGADMLYLNTAFAAPQLGEVCEREKPQRGDPRPGVHRAHRQGRGRAAADPGLGRRRRR